MSSRRKANRAFAVSLCLLSCTFACAFVSLASQVNGAPAVAADSTASAATVSDSDLRPAKQIIDDAIKAYGGVFSFKKAKDRSYRATGKVVVISGISGGTNAFSCEIKGKKDKILVETTVLGQKSISGYDGDVSWSQNGSWVSQNSPTATRRVADEVKHGFDSLLDCLESGARLEALPRKVIDGVNCEVVRLHFQGGPTTLYFDPVSHLVTRTEFAGDDPEQGHKIVKGFAYLDYRQVGGVPSPFKTVEYAGDKRISETVLDKLDIDVDLPDSVFAMPLESSIDALRNGPVTVPFEYAENEVVIKVKINGKEYRFLVDSGASSTVIDKKVALAVGGGDSSTFNITAGGQSIPLNYLTTPAITIGDVTVNDISSLVTDMNAIGVGLSTKPAGILGANVLKRFLVTFNYPERTLILADPKNVKLAPEAVAIPTAPAFGSTALVVPATLNGKKSLNFLVDTGAAFNNLPPALAKDFYSGPLLRVGKVAGMDGKPINMCSLQLDTMQLGSLKIRRPVFGTVSDGGAPAGLVNASSMGILGNPLWSQFKVTLDYRNERLILEPPPGKQLFDEFADKMEKVQQKFLRDKNTTAARSVLDALKQDAADRNCQQAEALCADYLGSIEFAEYLQSGSASQFHLAETMFENGKAVAAKLGNRALQARILADWALIYLEDVTVHRPANTAVKPTARPAVSPNARAIAAVATVAGAATAGGPIHPPGRDLLRAQNLILQALELSPLEPQVYAVLAKATQQVGRDLLAEKLTDQALLLDPDNWQALWTKLKITRKLDQPDASLVVAQLKRFYGDVPEVAALHDSGKEAGKP